MPKWLKWILKALLVVVAVVACVGLAVATAGAGLGFVGAALTAGFVGAAVSMGGQLLSDIGTSIVTGTWYMSSLKDYIGSAVGGFVGGALFAATGSAAVSFGISAGLSSAITGLLKGESFISIFVNSVISASIGAIFGKFFGGSKMPGVTEGTGSFLSTFKAGLTKMIRYSFKMAPKVVLRGTFAAFIYKSFSYLLRGISKGLDFSKLIVATN